MIMSVIRPRCAGSRGPPGVLRIEQVGRPAPRDDELLVQVRASTVNRLDYHTREANRSNGLVISGVSRVVSGIRRPRQRILGTEFAGEVAAAGPAVTGFGAGDGVFGNTGLRFGCHAEFTCVPETARVAPMPAGMGFEKAAAATDGALNALWCLRLAGPLTGRRMLVYGASGAIGTAAVQLAKAFGAEVTAVCGPTGAAAVQAIGADRRPATSRRSRRLATSSWPSATANALPHPASGRLLMTCIGVHVPCRQHQEWPATSRERARRRRDRALAGHG
jgi:NADPH:quinone reductase-like Zn-dependent oxidoreductase